MLKLTEVKMCFPRHLELESNYNWTFIVRVERRNLNPAWVREAVWKLRVSAQFLDGGTQKADEVVLETDEVVVVEV